MTNSTKDQPARASKTPGDGPGKPKRRRRRTPLFPSSTFEDALGLAEAIHRNAGDSVRRITILDQLGKSPSSSATRQWISNSSKYGLTTGSHAAEMLSLTPAGLKAVDEAESIAVRTRARFELAIEHIEVFKKLYERNLDNRLPVQAVLMDQAEELGIPQPDLNACVETFTVNAKFVGVLRSIAGAERLITIDALVDDYLPADTNKPAEAELAPVSQRLHPSHQMPQTSATTPQAEGQFENICFYVTPIGDEESEARKHADLFMGSLLEPALQEFGIQIVRADKIGEAGMISRQVIQHIVHSKLVIADLSFHNPNVFYELALRHAVRKPIVQITRLADPLPFDIAGLRTVVVDTTDIYTLVPQLASYQAQIAAQVRMALEEGADAESPISVFAPGFWSDIAS